jgi:holin-like protein
MFIPGAVGLLDNLEFLKPLLIPIVVMILISTSLVIGVTGQTAQLLLKKKGGTKK